MSKLIWRLIVLVVCLGTAASYASAQTQTTDQSKPPNTVWKERIERERQRRDAARDRRSQLERERQLRLQRAREARERRFGREREEARERRVLREREEARERMRRHHRRHHEREVEEAHERHTPPGWDKGKKTGWGDCNLPPGQAKKHGCEPR